MPPTANFPPWGSTSVCTWKSTSDRNSPGVARVHGDVKVSRNIPSVSPGPQAHSLLYCQMPSTIIKLSGMFYFHVLGLTLPGRRYESHRKPHSSYLQPHMHTFQPPPCSPIPCPSGQEAGAELIRMLFLIHLAWSPPLAS